jgi:hypothetical protein
MASRPKPLLDETKAFVRYHLGKGCFAPHTGQDHPAWCAFVYLVQCHAHGGGEDAIEAMRRTLQCAQTTEAVMRTFVQVIPAIADWSTVRDLWPKITDRLAVRGFTGDIRRLTAYERAPIYDANHKEIDAKIFAHGWSGL